MSIHPTAIIAEGAEIASDVEIGAYSVIGPKVRIGSGTWIGPHVVIEGRTTIGRNNRIFQFAALGAIPQDLKYHGEDSELIIGDDNQIREFTTMHLGTEGGGNVTRVGNGSLFMAYSHVAHDVTVGDRCIIANCAAIAGHVILENDVHIGGLAGLHQFTRVGCHSFVAAGAVVTQDVPPYCIVQGDRAALAGLNSVGLARTGFTPDAITRIKSAYKTLFRNNELGLREAIARVRAEHGGNEEIDHLLTFLEGSTRGAIQRGR